MDFNVLADFYVKGYAAVRNSEHIVDGNNELMVIIHDAFQVSQSQWLREHSNS